MFFSYTAVIPLLESIKKLQSLTLKVVSGTKWDLVGILEKYFSK